MSRALASTAVLCLILLAPASHAAPPPPLDVEVTTCGQVIPDKTLGYLSADLDCTGFTGGPSNVDSVNAGAAVYLGKKSRLDLRGFTITSGHHGVMCDALVCGHIYTHHACSKGPCEVFNGTLVSASGVNGIVGYRPVIHDLTITGFYFGVIALDRLQLGNATVTDNATTGVAGKKLTIAGTSITNNGIFGVDGWTDRGHGVRLTDSTVSGNGTDAQCASITCADLAGMRQPRLQNSTCDTSLNLRGGTWGVCAGD
jgi:hypothetical protein